MGVRDMDRFLKQWQMDAKALRRRMILAPTPRERERWYAILLPGQPATAEALGGPTHHTSAFGEGSLADRGALGETQQADLRAAVQELPEQARIGQLVLEGGASVCLGRFGIELSRLFELSGWDSS